LFIAGGEVMIWECPGVWHWVVIGPVLTQSGAAAATGAIATAAHAPATAKTIGKTFISAS
jgi:hypothetical protein